MIRQATNPEFQSPGTLERPRPIGRAVRIVASIYFLAPFAWILTEYRTFVSSDIPSLPLLVLMLVNCVIALFLLPSMINVLITVSWGRWASVVVVLLAVAAVVFDLVRYGTFWGPPLGLFIFLLAALVFAHFGLSFILGGILALPG